MNYTILIIEFHFAFFIESFKYIVLQGQHEIEEQN